MAISRFRVYAAAIAAAAIAPIAVASDISHAGGESSTEYPVEFDVRSYDALMAAPPPPPLGDMNCDGTVNAKDIEPFITSLLVSGRAYRMAFPTCSMGNADMNSDGLLDDRDIEPFLAKLKDFPRASDEDKRLAEAVAGEPSRFTRHLVIGKARVGDMNCDHAIDESDIKPFTLALIDSAAYAQEFPECYARSADLSGDGLLDPDDVGPFVATVKNALGQ